MWFVLFRMGCSWCCNTYNNIKTVICNIALNEDYKLHIKKTLIHKFDFKILRKVLQVGISYGIENRLFQLGRVLVLSIVLTFGTMAIAANSVGYAVGIFSVLSGFAINLDLTVVISRCVGANDYEQVRYYNKKMFNYCICVTYCDQFNYFCSIATNFEYL